MRRVNGGFLPPAFCVRFFVLKHVPPRSLWKWGKVRHLYLNLKERGTKRPAEICPLVFAKRLCNPFRWDLSIRRHAVSGELPAPLVILWEVLKGMIPRPTRGIMSFYMYFTDKKDASDLWRLCSILFIVFF